MSLVVVLVPLLLVFALLGLMIVVTGGASRPTVPPLAPPRSLPASPTRWRAAHRTGPDGSTLVVVERVPLDGGEPTLEVRQVARVEEADPDWERTFTDAMARARERAALLSAESGE